MPRRSIRNTRLVPDRAASSRIGLHSVSPCCAPQVTRAALSRCRRGFQLGARRAPRRPTLLRCSPSSSRKGAPSADRPSQLRPPPRPSSHPPPPLRWQRGRRCGPSEVVVRPKCGRPLPPSGSLSSLSLSPLAAQPLSLLALPRPPPGRLALGPDPTQSLGTCQLAQHHYFHPHILHHHRSPTSSSRATLSSS